MNLWKHDEEVRYNQTIYGESMSHTATFDVPPEASLRHIEKNVLKRLILALEKKFKKENVQRIDVSLHVYSVSTYFDFSSFIPTSSAMRVALSEFADVNDWNVVAHDMQPHAQMNFEITLYGRNLCR